MAAPPGSDDAPLRRSDEAQRRRSDEAQLRRDLVDAQRSLVVHSQHVAHAFADQQGLHPTDLEALIHVMHAENAGGPLTPGQLGAALELSSAATTGVVDRLERAGHLQRERDTTDRRRVHLRCAAPAMAVAAEFFRPLGERSDEVMAEFSGEELRTVHRYLTAMASAMDRHARATRRLDAPTP